MTSPDTSTATVPANQDSPNYPTGPDDRDLTDGGTRFPSLDEIDYATTGPAGVGSNTVQPNEVYAPFVVDGNDTSAYIGVNPEYMTYANETDKPFKAEGGVEEEREAAFLASATPVRVEPVAEGEQTLGQGSTHETIYTATSGENYVAAQAVTEDTPDEAPVTEEVTKEQTPATPAQAQTVTTPTPTVDVTTPATDEQKADIATPTPPPAATTGSKTPAKNSPTGTGTDPAASPAS